MEKGATSQSEPERASVSSPEQAELEPRPSRARVHRPNRTPPSRSSSSWTSSPRTPSAHRGGVSVACCAHARGSPAHRTSRLAHEGSCALMSTAAWTSVPDMEQADPDPMMHEDNMEKQQPQGTPPPSFAERRKTVNKARVILVDSFSVSSLFLHFSFLSSIQTSDVFNKTPTFRSMIVSFSALLTQYKPT